MSQPLRICLVKKKLDAETVVDCLESIKFGHQGETFQFPEEFQPLRNHPVVAEQSKVIKILRTMREVNQYRYIRIHLSEEHRPLYIDDDGRFRFAGQLLEEGLDRSRMGLHGPQNGNVQNFACIFKELGCIFEGSPSALEDHLASAALLHLSLTSALVSRQHTTIEGMKEKISRQEREISNLKTDIDCRLGDILEHEAKFSKQQTEMSVLREELLDSTMNTSGTLLWKIPNYAAQLRESKSGKIDYKSSQPFLTSPQGYKLRAMLYLDGLAKGEGTHSSLFIQILPGPYDSLLRWPFPLKVSFTLMDQSENPNEASHKTISFVADPSKGNCQRPREESGGWSYPKFVSHETLGTRDYVKEDTIFIKIQIG